MPAWKPASSAWRIARSRPLGGICSCEQCRPMRVTGRSYPAGAGQDHRRGSVGLARGLGAACRVAQALGLVAGGERLRALLQGLVAALELLEALALGALGDLLLDLGLGRLAGLAALALGVGGLAGALLATALGRL